MKNQTQLMELERPRWHVMHGREKHAQGGSDNDSVVKYPQAKGDFGLRMNYAFELDGISSFPAGSSVPKQAQTLSNNQTLLIHSNVISTRRYIEVPS